jgi:hypothetical protein
VTGDGSADYNAMLEAMSQAPTYRFGTEVVIGPVGQRVTLTGDGEYQAPDRLHYTYQSIGLPIEVVIIGGDTYLRQPDGNWQQGAVQPELNPLRIPLDVRTLLGLLTYAATARLLGDEPLPGGDTPARHLAFTLAPNALGAAAHLGWTQAEGELWLTPATHRLLRLRLIFGAPDGSGPNDGTITTDFRDYDAPISIGVPGS